jgi:hypothetical protein
MHRKSDEGWAVGRGCGARRTNVVRHVRGNGTAMDSGMGMHMPGTHHAPHTRPHTWRIRIKKHIRAWTRLRREGASAMSEVLPVFVQYLKRIFPTTARPPASSATSPTS